MHFQTMSGLTREIVTLQVGHYANFVGTHWWNIQVNAVNYFIEAGLRMQAGIHSKLLCPTLNLDTDYDDVCNGQVGM